MELSVPTEDTALLAQIAAGSLDAFQRFYRRYAGKVLAYARQLGRDRELAEDVAQEIFIAVWSKAGSFRPDRGDAAGWLYAMTRNRMIDHWRKRGNAPAELFDVQQMSSSAGDGVDLPLAVRQALTRVEPDQRRAIEMAYFGGLTYEETAERLDLPLGTLKSRIRSGLRVLREMLGPTAT
jgi:RNA polymerase sigma-70 factor (ECF subfamily)